MACTEEPQNFVKRKHLKTFLDSLDDFEAPKRHLEQYATPNNIATDALIFIDREDNAIRNKFVIDLGCGTGKLSLGCCFMGAGHVVGVDIDESAVLIAHRNSILTLGEGYGSVDFITCDVSDFGSSTRPDTIIMNPPFGSSAVDRMKGKHKNKQKPRSKHVLSSAHVRGTTTNGPDRAFIAKAGELISDDGAIYMFHSRKAQKFLEKLACDLNLSIKVVVDINFDLEYTSPHHHDSSRDIEVFLYKLCKKK